MHRAAFWLRLGTGGAGFGLAVLWYVIILAIPMSKARRRQSFARAMASLCCRPLGIRVRIHGRENIGPHHPCIYVSNHQSQVDYPIGGTVFPGDALVVASRIGDWPVMGALFRSSGCIVLDRDTPVRAAAALEEAETALRTGNSIWIFAEGTRGRVPGTLGPFKRGAFRLAVATGRPIIPVVISPLKPHTDLRGRRLDPRDVVLSALAPVFPSADSRDAEDELREAVRRKMEEALGDLAAVGDGGSRGAPGVSALSRD